MIRPRREGEEEGGEGGGRMREGRLSSSTCEHGRRGSHGLQDPVYQIPLRRDKVVVHEKAQNSARKRAQLGPSNEGERAHEDAGALTRHSPSFTIAHPLTC